MSRFAFVLLSFVFALAGCGREGPPREQKFLATDVTGAPWGRDFHLTDHTGRARSLADFRGKVVVLFFGYTHCPDVCPTTLADMAETMKLLGEDARRVQVLFATLDPERDTPDLLAQYVPAFHPDFLGLYGDAATVAAQAKEFKVFYQKHGGNSPDSYTLDHSATSFVFDPQGRLRLVLAFGTPPQAIAHDLKLLLAGN